MDTKQKEDVLAYRCVRCGSTFKLLGVPPSDDGRVCYSWTIDRLRAEGYLEIEMGESYCLNHPDFYRVYNV